MRARTSARLGADFLKLWTASAVSSLGDGVTMVAGPLLVASLTPDPALVAGAAFVQSLPWLLFSLISGVFADRLDRQRLIVIVNAVRGAALGGLPAIVPRERLAAANARLMATFTIGNQFLLLGGVFARELGLTAPFWLAGAAMILVTAAAWTPLRAASGR